MTASSDELEFQHELPLNDFVWDVQAVEDALFALSEGFEWARSSQGHEYWATVVSNLQAIKRLGAHNEADKAIPRPWEI
jgi:hypothetical protein